MQSINLVDAEIYGDIVQHTFNDISIKNDIPRIIMGSEIYISIRNMGSGPYTNYLFFFSFFFFKHIYNEIQFVVLSQTLKCKFLDISLMIRADGYHS